MLSLLRASPKQASVSFRRCLRPTIRQYARVADSPQPSPDGDDAVLSIAPPGGLPDTPSTSLVQTNQRIAKYRVQVKEDHGLYAFFRKEEDDSGEVTYHTVEPPEGDVLYPSGRAWKASELRLKSFQDLHTLWYVVLRERNLLATQKEEARRMGIQNPSAWTSSKKATLCRKTMARIKYVLNERRLAYEGAVKLVQEEAEEVEAKKEDEKVLKYQLQEWRKGRALRRAARQRRRQADEAGAEASQSPAGEATDVSQGAELETNAKETHIEEQTSTITSEKVVEVEAIASTPVPTSTPEEPINVLGPAEKAKTRSERKAERQKKEEEALLAKETPEGIDAAESSLFGDPVKKKS